MKSLVQRLHRISFAFIVLAASIVSMPSEGHAFFSFYSAPPVEDCTNVEIRTHADASKVYRCSAIHGYLKVYRSNVGYLSLPYLYRVNGYISIYGNANLTSVYVRLSHVDGNISVSYNAKLRSLALYNDRTNGGGYNVTRNTNLQSASLNRLTSLGYMMQLYGNSSLRDARFPALGASPSTKRLYIRYNYQLSHCDTENLRQTLTSLTYTTVSNTRNDTVDLYRDNDRVVFG